MKHLNTVPTFSWRTAIFATGFVGWSAAMEALIPILAGMATTTVIGGVALGTGVAAYHTGTWWHDANNSEDNSFYKVISGRGRNANDRNPVDIIPLQYKGEPWVASIYGKYEENFVSLLNGKLADLDLGWKLINPFGSRANNYKSDYIRYFKKSVGGGS